MKYKLASIWNKETNQPIPDTFDFKKKFTKTGKEIGSGRLYRMTEGGSKTIKFVCFGDNIALIENNLYKEFLIEGEEMDNSFTITKGEDTGKVITYKELKVKKATLLEPKVEKSVEKSINLNEIDEDSVDDIFPF